MVKEDSKIESLKPKFVRKKRKIQKFLTPMKESPKRFCSASTTAGSLETQKVPDEKIPLTYKDEVTKIAESLLDVKEEIISEKGDY
mmetsp:Transcript_12630/g.14212  ORF Transcript_12630/g.14212 Transcript_12630/m.14212 type:complete len:86 (+) Transcript_12630:821-1078(+)